MGDRRVWWAVADDWKAPQPFYGTRSKQKVRLLEPHPDSEGLEGLVGLRFHTRPGETLEDGAWLSDIACGRTPQEAVTALLTERKRERGWLLEQFREVDAQVSRWAGWLEDQVDADCPGRPEVK